MGYLKSYKELIVWQKAILLVKEIFLLTRLFPPTEIYGIIAQMRRAALSIPSNIAEGYGRGSRKEYVHFLTIAYGSALELETQIIIAKELHFTDVITFQKAEQFLDEVLRMLNTMINNKTLNPKP